MGEVLAGGWIGFRINWTSIVKSYMNRGYKIRLRQV